MPEARDQIVIADASQLFEASTRRKFLQVMSVGGAAIFLPSVFAACGDDDPVRPPGGDPLTLNLSNDTGILNYAFALEQLEAGFYTLVLSAPVFNTLSAAEQEIFTDLRNHEVIHREFFRAAIPAASRIPDLVLTLSAVTNALANRANLLLTTETFEDLGVSAYNGAGKYLTDVNNLAIAGKIVSVEARHAAVIRDVRDAGSTGTKFANSQVVDANGLDVKLEPSDVLMRADPFIETQVTIGTQPGPASSNFPPTNT